MARYTVEVPDTVGDRTIDAWTIYRAVIEAVETGASKHCCRRISPDNFEHHRLGVTVERLPDRPQLRTPR